MRRSSWLWVCPLVLATGMVACIKREPRVEVQQPVSTTAAAPAAVAPEARPPTGNWGKVKGVDLLGGKGVRAFGLAGETDRVKAKFVKVEGQGFAEAIRAEIREQSKNPWEVQLRALTTEPVDAGDVVLATVHFRTVRVPQDRGQGESEFVFELSRDPWTKSVTQKIRAFEEWQELYVPFVAGQKFKPGEAQIVFRLGFARQAVEFGAVTVENFGTQLALADLPTTRPSYAGIAPDAPWRKDAAERIEKIRKAELRVFVKDASGRPIPDAQVTVRQKQHSFQFGTSAPASEVLSEKSVRFREVLSELFTAVTLENDLRWVPLAGDWGSRFTLERATAAVSWLDQQGFSVRGASLVSSAWRDLPKRLRVLEKQPEKLRAEVDRHIRELVTAFRGKIDVWDVVEEPCTNRDLLDILGDRVLVEWFAAARAADPDAKLFINDSAMLSSTGEGAAHRQRLESILRMLVEANAPLDGIGLRGRVGSELIAPSDVVEQLDRLAKQGKKLYVTEFDLAVDDPELAAAYTRDFYTAVFSHPAVDGIVMWGFWDGAHWNNNAPLYRNDWSLKPAGAEFRKLVLETWRSNDEGTTNGNGAYVRRAFLGTYDVEVSAAGKSAKATTSLASSGSELVLVLK